MPLRNYFESLCESLVRVVRWCAKNAALGTKAHNIHLMQSVNENNKWISEIERHTQNAWMRWKSFCANPSSEPVNAPCSCCEVKPRRITIWLRNVHPEHANHAIVIRKSIRNGVIIYQFIKTTNERNARSKKMLSSKYWNETHISDATCTWTLLMVIETHFCTKKHFWAITDEQSFFSFFFGLFFRHVAQCLLICHCHFCVRFIAGNRKYH